MPTFVDTTSTVLSGLFFEIARNQEIQRKLYAEISAFAKDAGDLNTQNIKSLKYLQAVVDEGLRLWNPLPSGPQSMTGPEGLTVAGQFVPPYTYARVPHLTLLTGKHFLNSHR
jgi:cytochrome P450